LGCGQSCVQAVCGCYGQDADIPPGFANHPGRFDGFGCHSALIGNHNVTIGTGFAQPITTVNGALTEGIIMAFSGLFNWVGGQA
jgi:hypothetical protein